MAIPETEMPKAETLERFVALVEQNAHVEAVEEFYTEGSKGAQRAFEVDTGHDLMVTEPRRAADLLLGLLASSTNTT